MAVEGESEDLKKTTYQILYCNEEKKWWDQVFQMVTAAGKPCYKPSPQVVVTPMDFIKIKIEEKIKDLVAKDKNCAMAEHLNQLDSFSHQNMQYLSERDGSRHNNNNNKTEADEEKPEVNQNNTDGRYNAQINASKTNVKKKLTRAVSAHQKQSIEKKVNEMKITSRWLADSAITTFYGKPAFHAYGNGNTNPTVGGTIYGNYLKTHNVNPQSGDNHPEFKQVFTSALVGAVTHDAKMSKSPAAAALTKKTPHARQPILPRKLV